MRIHRIATLADDMEKVYDDLHEALEQLGRDNIGKTKIEIKKALKKLEEIRPHLKDKDKPTASGLVRKY